MILTLQASQDIILKISEQSYGNFFFEYGQWTNFKQIEINGHFYTHLVVYFQSFCHLYIIH